MDTSELLKKIPSGWHDMKLKDYLQFLEKTNGLLTINELGEDTFDGVDNTLPLLSMYTGATVKELEEMPGIQLKQLAKRLDFVTQMPAQIKNPSIKWKTVDELTYGEFTAFQLLRENLDNNLANLFTLLAYREVRSGWIFWKKKQRIPYTVEDALELPMDEILTGFFLLLPHFKTCARSTQIFSLLHLLKLALRMKWQQLAQFFRLRRKAG